MSSATMPSNNALRTLVYAVLGFAIAVLLVTQLHASDVPGKSAAAQPKFFQVQVTGHGKPMILIPGLASSGETWDGTVAHYKNEYQCHVLTLAGFAGVPPVPAAVQSHQLLQNVVDSLDAYIHANQLAQPVIVGHSLGGEVALMLAEQHPNDVGRLVIVDSVPFLPRVWSPVNSPADAKPQAEAVLAYMGAQTQAQYDAYVRAGQATRGMVTSDADFQKLVRWGLASDPHTVADAMYELFTTDLRPGLSKIKSPTLIIGTWVGLKGMATRDQVNSGFHSQYADLKQARFDLNDKARHFVMFDDPAGFLQQVDSFLQGAPLAPPMFAETAAVAK